MTPANGRKWPIVLKNSVSFERLLSPQKIDLHNRSVLNDRAFLSIKPTPKNRRKIQFLSFSTASADQRQWQCRLSIQHIFILTDADGDSDNPHQLFIFSENAGALEFVEPCMPRKQEWRNLAKGSCRLARKETSTPHRGTFATGHCFLGNFGL